MNKEELARVLAEWLGQGSPKAAGEHDERLAEQSDEPEIDRQVLQDLFAEVGAENFSQVLPVFLGELKEGQRALQAAWETNALGEIAHRAHTLSSSVRSFGAKRLGEMLTTIELAAKEGSDQVVAQEMRTLSPVWMRAVEALESLGAEMIAGSEPN